MGNFNDEILCDVVHMEACHISMGRLWHLDKKKNYSSWFNQRNYFHPQ